MKLTVLGGCGAWPEAGGACSGYLVEFGSFVLLIDPGYATVPRLLQLMPAERVDAVLVSHGHPDHCADLNPLLRARAFRDDPAGPLPVTAPRGALDAVLALDRPAALNDAYTLDEFDPGNAFTLGPFSIESRLLPHHLPNAGLRLSVGRQVLAYTGDAGSDPATVTLARRVDLFLCEATYVDSVPGDSLGQLCTAREAGELAAKAEVARLVLTHLLPGTDPAAAIKAAAIAYRGPIEVARPGLVTMVAESRPA
jgi:ribonuclease BN (tRNA processing enzyme)